MDTQYLSKVGGSLVGSRLSCGSALTVGWFRTGLQCGTPSWCLRRWRTGCGCEEEPFSASSGHLTTPNGSLLFSLLSSLIFPSLAKWELPGGMNTGGSWSPYSHRPETELTWSPVKWQRLWNWETEALSMHHVPNRPPRADDHGG